MKKTVSIIGAGPAGLVAAKECLEAGLDPIIFEKASDLGGVWNPLSGKVWHSMQANLSNFHMGFSDFPWPEETEDFVTHGEVYQYLKDYAYYYALEEKTQYNQSIVQMNCALDKWVVHTADGQKHDTDYAIIASGFFNAPHLPKIDNQEKFQGSIQHSGAYRTPHAYKKQHVLVIGGSFSGYEITSDLAAVGVKVTHAFRKPSWIAHRYNEMGIPFDLTSYTYPFSKLDAHYATHSPEKNLLRNKGRLRKLGQPGDAHPALFMNPNSSYPESVVISDDYIDHINAGLINPIKAAPVSFDEKNCLLSSGQAVNADTVIFCTGYDVSLPINNDAINKVLSYDAHDKFQATILNKGVFHPRYKNLAFNGVIRGPYFGTTELDARWTAGVFSGQIPYPSDLKSQEGLKEEELIRAQNPRPAYPRENYVLHMLQLARELDVLPKDIMKQVSDDDEVPMIPADFRRFGIGAKDGIAEDQRNRLMQRLGL